MLMGDTRGPQLRWGLVDRWARRQGSVRQYNCDSISSWGWGLGTPRAGNSHYTLSTAVGKWGDLAAVIYPLHPHLGNKRVGVDHLCGSCPPQHSVTKFLVPGTSMRKSALGETKIFLSGAPGGLSSSRQGAASPTHIGRWEEDNCTQLSDAAHSGNFITNTVYAKQFSTCIVMLIINLQNLRPSRWVNRSL